MPPREADAMQILLVDDEELIRHYLSDILVQAGHRVATAADGLDALEHLADASIDLILSDIRMPRMGGIDLLERLQDEPAPPPVILLTGYADVQAGADAVRLGARDFLLKPVECHVLLQCIDRLQQECRLQEALTLERQRNQYMARMAAVGQLAAGVAHEINNPATYVRGGAQLLRAYLDQLETFWLPDSAPREPRELLNKMRETSQSVLRGTDRIKRIVNSLVSIAGSGEEDPGQHDSLRGCVEHCLELQRGAIEGIELSLSFASDLEDRNPVSAPLGQALLCILQNAVQAVAEAPRKVIRVTLEPAADTGGVAIAIEDSGPGIPPESREAVFEPFYTTRDVGEGKGLGLSIAWGIVCLDHHGDLAVDESPLGGARVRIVLPGVASADALPDPREQSPSSSTCASRYRRYAAETA